MQTMDNLIEFCLHAVGFAAALRAAFHVRKGVAGGAVLYALLSWIAVMTRGLFFGPPRTIQAHVGFGAAYAAVLFLLIGGFLFLYRRKQGTRRNSDG